jgi:hypothetical protein
MDDLRLYGAPRTTLTGPYVRIIIGGGGKGNVKLFRSGHFSNRVPAVRNIVGGLAK